MLFEVKKLEKLVALATSASGLVDGGQQLVAAVEKLHDVINLVDHGRTVNWMSDGDWSMHQLLQELLQKIGPADVWISSYAFSELPARTVCDLKTTGVITKLHCIIDSRVDVRSASALSMLRNSCNAIKLCATHAKVTVLKNNEWFIVIVGSANYTTNKRYECGIISTDAGICHFHKNWIENELQKPV